MTVQKKPLKKTYRKSNFKCDICNKTFLSYPSLYTHNKKVHPNQGKNHPVLSNLDDKDKQSKKRLNLVYPKTDKFFQCQGREGGPSNPLIGFQEMLDKFKYQNYKSETDFPMYKYLERFALLGGFSKTNDDLKDREEVKIQELNLNIKQEAQNISYITPPDNAQIAKQTSSASD